MTRSQPDDPLRCTFCQYKFTSERRLVNHICEPKRRYLQRDDKAVRLGFTAFQKFYQQSMRRRTAPNYDEFANNRLYSAFVRFGKHIMDLNAINPLAFIDFVLRTQARIDDWTNQSLYNTYVRELTRNEPPLEAIERNFMLMEQWSMDHPGEEWHNFFRHVEPALAVLWLTAGRISPWILFTASSAKDLLNRMSPEQMRWVEQLIDAEFWRRKIERHKDEVEAIRTLLAEHGI
jgi:hypothetical protein